MLILLILLLLLCPFYKSLDFLKIVVNFQEGFTGPLAIQHFYSRDYINGCITHNNGNQEAIMGSIFQDLEKDPYCYSTMGFALHTERSSVVILQHPFLLLESQKTLYFSERTRHFLRQNLDHRGASISIKTLILLEVPGNFDPEAFLLKNQPLSHIPRKFNEDAIVGFFMKDNSSNGCSIELWDFYDMKFQHGKQLIVGRIKRGFVELPEKCPEFTEDCGDCLQIYLKAYARNQYLLEPLLQRRGDFMGNGITAALSGIDEVDSFNHTGRKFQGESKTLNFANVMNAHIFVDLKRMMNFKYSLEICNYNHFVKSSRQPDMTVYGILHTLKRSQEVDFLQPTYSTNFEAFYLRPTFHSMHNVYKYPFKTSVWITLALIWTLLFLSTVFIRICLEIWFVPLDLNKSTPKKQSQLPELGTPTRIPYFREILNDTFLSFIALICNKSSSFLPMMTSLRIAYLSGTFLGVLVFAEYSSILYSFLAAPHSPIGNFKDLVSFGFTFSVHEKSLPSQALLRSLIKEHDLKQEVTTTDSLNQITRILDNPSHSTITYKTIVYREGLRQNYSEVFLCQSIKSVPVDQGHVSSSFVLPKGSEFKEAFNYRIIMLYERGFLYRYLKEYDVLQGGGFCSSTSLEDLDLDLHSVPPVVIKAVLTPICILTLGITCSLTFWVIELGVKFTRGSYLE